MRFSSFGWTGEQAPLIGQGTWEIERDPEQRAIEALRLGIDFGMTLIDTAGMYGNGRAEQIVGQAIRGRRAGLFIVSKVLPSNASYDGTRRACERSLERLGIDQLIYTCCTGEAATRSRKLCAASNRWFATERRGTSA